MLQSGFPFHSFVTTPAQILPCCNLKHTKKTRSLQPEAHPHPPPPSAGAAGSRSTPLPGVVLQTSAPPPPLPPTNHTSVAAYTPCQHAALLDARALGKLDNAVEAWGGRRCECRAIGHRLSRTGVCCTTAPMNVNIQLPIEAHCIYTPHLHTVPTHRTYTPYLHTVPSRVPKRESAR